MPLFWKPYTSDVTNFIGELKAKKPTLEAAAEGPERDALFSKLVAQQYQRGEAMNMASSLEIDAVIDPADTRAWLARGLAGSRVREVGAGFVDTW